MGKTMPKIMIDISLAPENFAWYTVVTKYNYEKKFEHDLLAGLDSYDLHDYIEEVVVPFREYKEEKKLKSGEIKIKTKTEKIYPNYVFVKCVMNESVWNYVRNTSGCAAVLATGESLITTSDEEIYKIKEICGLLAKEKEKNNAIKEAHINEILNKYKEGKRIEIKSGIFKGYMGNIDSVDPAKLKININLDNGISVELDIEDLE